MNFNFKKCGNLYVYFDENKYPLYSFEVVDNTFKKFHLISKRMPKEIVLPKVEFSKNDSSKIDNSSMLEAVDMLETYKNDFIIRSGCLIELEQYATGAVRISNGCFEGIKSLKLVVPVNYSVMLDDACFDPNAEVELILPKDMTLKQIFKTYDASFNFDHDNWTLISHKNFNFTSQNYRGISIKEFNPEYARHYSCKISDKTINPSKSSAKIENDFEK